MSQPTLDELYEQYDTASAEAMAAFKRFDLAQPANWDTVAYDDLWEALKTLRRTATSVKRVKGLIE